MEVACGLNVYTIARSGPLMTKLMEILGLKSVEPKDVAIENLAADTRAVADEVAKRRERFEALGFPFAEAMEMERTLPDYGYRRGIDD